MGPSEKEATGSREKGKVRTGNRSGQGNRWETKVLGGSGDEGEGGEEIKAHPKREFTGSGAGLLQPSDLPRGPRFPGDTAPTPPRPGEARALTGGPPGPSAPRLPRPRLPPARPRARSPAHAAGHWPQPPGWDRSKLLVAAACAGSAVATGEHWAGWARRPDTQLTAHARAAPARAPCWTGGVKAPLRVSSR